MLLLHSLSTLIIFAVVLPRSVYSRLRRELRGFCMYDLAGLSIPGRCLRCGQYNAETAILRTNWIMRWRMIPRVGAAMIVPALSPAQPALVGRLVEPWTLGSPKPA